MNMKYILGLIVIGMSTTTFAQEIVLDFNNLSTGYQVKEHFDRDVIVSIKADRSRINEVEQYKFKLDDNTNFYSISNEDIKSSDGKISFQLKGLSSVQVIKIFDAANSIRATIKRQPAGSPENGRGGSDTSGDMVVISDNDVNVTGIPLHDAILIADYLKNKNQNKEKIVFILAKYGLVDEDSINANPFFPDDLKELASVVISQSAGQGLVQMVSKIGDANVTNLVDGLARFLVQRTKEELNVYFFEQLNDFIKTSEYKTDINILLPSTSAVLLVAGDQVYNYQAYLPALRDAFHQDLAELLPHTSSLLRADDSKLLENLRKDKKGLAIAKLSVDLASSVTVGRHPGDAVRMLSDSAYIKDIHNNALQTIKTINILSQSVRSATTDKYWAAENAISQLHDVTTLKIYLGLLFHQIPSDLAFYKVNNHQVNLKQLMVDKWAGANSIPVLQWMDKFREIDVKINKLKKDEDVLTGVDLVTDIIDLASGINSEFDLNINPVVIENLKFYAEHGSGMIIAINNKAWHSLVFDSYQILNKASGGNESSHNEFLRKYLKYGTFMAAVASANNSVEVQDAIEAISLPTGSARIKRESKFNIAINSYVGPFMGKERLKKENDENNDALSVGLSVPVGVAFSLGFCKKGYGKSITVMTSLVDIGAVTAYRFGDEETDVVPEIKLKNIFSPGILAFVGLGKVPISLGIGAQMGPRLRQIGPDVASVYEDHYIRYFGTIAVDIPLLNLYNKSHN